MSAGEISLTIKEAQRYVTAHDYDKALICYARAQQDIEQMVFEAPSEARKKYWEGRREQLRQEAQRTLDLSGELKAFGDPAEAVRKNQRRLCANGAREGGRNNSSFPRTISNPIAAKNTVLYGDPDRFGPPLDAEFTPVFPNGFPDDARRPIPRLPQRRQASTRRVMRREEEENARSAECPGGKRKGKKGIKEEANYINGHPRYLPRPGEEELVQSIEGDMSAGDCSVSWGDIGGLDEAKRLLEEAVVYPVLMPDYYQGIRRPWKGVLLYGPPGTGKTMLAKAVASECNTTFFNISPATLTSKWRGESEKLIRVLFEMARHYAPSTVFIDEIDSLCGQRGDHGEHEASRRAKGTLLAQMDGVGVDSNKIVMVLGATNHPWDIDEAMRRRLEKRIYIPLPANEDREELFRLTTKTLKLSDDVDFTKLSSMLEGRYYSCADITNVVRDAAMMTMRRMMGKIDKAALKEHGSTIGKKVAEQPISMEDFLTAIKNVPSSINAENIQKFEAWAKEFEA